MGTVNVEAFGIVLKEGRREGENAREGSIIRAVEDVKTSRIRAFYTVHTHIHRHTHTPYGYQDLPLTGLCIIVSCRA